MTVNVLIELLKAVNGNRQVVMPNFKTLGGTISVGNVELEDGQVVILPVGK